MSSDGDARRSPPASDGGGGGAPDVQPVRVVVRLRPLR
jgi:hypothetical protein